MFYASTVGLARVYERICQFEKEMGERWRPARLLRRLAEEGKSFREFDEEKGA